MTAYEHPDGRCGSVQCARCYNLTDMSAPVNRPLPTPGGGAELRAHTSPSGHGYSGPCRGYETLDGQQAPCTCTELRDSIDRTVDTDPLKLRDALYAVLNRLDAEVEGARRQMEAGDYRLCPPDMLRIYCHEAIEGALT